MNDAKRSRTKRIATVLIVGLVLFTTAGVIGAAQSADALLVGYRYCGAGTNGADIIIRHDELPLLGEDQRDCDDID